MAGTFPSALSLILLLISSSASAAVNWQQGECGIMRINAQEPSFRLQSEGGVSEFWDHNSDEFQCAGVSLHRHTIRSRGLLLPVYHNAPMLVYVLQGRGIYGITVSGCPETFESSQKSPDRHQQIGFLKPGDVVAIRAGDAHWAYNNGGEDLIVVVLQDNSNYANQLDRNPRSFFLAGNPDMGQQQQKEQLRFHGERKQAQHEFGNVFNGMSVESLAEVFEVDVETARKLQSQNDERGMIVTVEREMQVMKPPLRERNGVGETICSSSSKDNVDNPSRAAIYNPQAGSFSTVNSFTLPVLSYLRLSFAKGTLHQNAIMAPHWLSNAHSIMYMTRGDSFIQVVNQNGQAVFEGQVRAGQVLVVPHNFAVIKKAGEEGCEWVEFQTNANAIINTLTGRTSAITALPVQVVATAYQISREEANSLKSSRRETLLFSSTITRSPGRRVASA